MNNLPFVPSKTKTREMTQFQPIVAINKASTKSSRSEILTAVEHALQQLGDLEIYIHIPFCHEICTFCPYAKSAADLTHERLSSYPKSVEAEMASMLKFIRPNSINSIFIGGGTPSTLQPEQLLRLINPLQSNGSLFKSEQSSQLSVSRRTYNALCLP